MAGSRPTTMKSRPCGRSISAKRSSSSGTDAVTAIASNCARYGQGQSVGHFELDVTDAAGRELGFGGRREIGKNVDARYALREASEAGGQIAAARADDEHLVDRLHLERLQDSAFDLRCEHGLAVPERNLGVGEREVAVVARDEILAWRFRESAQHAFVEHFPCPQLLAEHLGACNLEVHGCSYSGCGAAGERGRVRSLFMRYKAVCEELWSITDDAPGRLLYRRTPGEAAVWRLGPGYARPRDAPDAR